MEPDINLKKPGDDNKWLSLSEAALHTPYSAEYLSLLARKGKLVAKKIDNTWYTTRAVLDAYMKKQMLRQQVQNGHVELPTLEPVPQIGMPAVEDVVVQTSAAKNLSLSSIKSHVVRNKTLFALMIVCAIFFTILPIPFVFSSIERGLDFVKSFSNDANTVMGFRPGTHANELLLLDKAGNIAITGHIETYGQLVSHAPDGTVPIVVDSKTLVKNLNAEYVNNLSSADFTLAFVTKNGAVTTEDVQLDGNVEVGKALNVKGATNLDGDLTVLGNAEFQKILKVVGPAEFESVVKVMNDLEVSGTISAGSGRFQGGLEAHTVVGSSGSFNSLYGGKLRSTVAEITSIAASDISVSALTSTTTSADELYSASSSLSNVTFELATGTSATTTNFYADNATFGNLIGTTLNFANFLVTGSSTLQDFTFLNSTGTSATTTSFFSTTASTTHLFGTDINGFGLSTCTGNSQSLHWSGGVLSCVTLSGFASSTLLTDNNAFTGLNTFSDLKLVTRSTSTNATTTGSLFTNFLAFVTGSTTNLTAIGSTTLQNFTFLNATGTSATTTNFFATTASTSQLSSAQIYAGAGTASLPSIAFSNDSGLNTGLYWGGENVVGFSAGGTSLAFGGSSFRPNVDLSTDLGSASQRWNQGFISSLISTYATTTNFLALGSTTLQNFTGLKATTTNATSTNSFATTASSTNLFFSTANGGHITSSGLGTFQNILTLGSTTLQSFTALNATTSSATSTNFFTTTGSSTNLFFTNSNGGALTLSGTASFPNLLLTGSSTLQNLTFSNATGTAATTTSLYSDTVVVGTGSVTTLVATTLTSGSITDTGLAGSGTRCLQTDNNGLISIAASTCGTGGGSGSGGGSWATTTSQVSGEYVNYSLNNSDIVAIGNVSTTTASIYFDPNILRTKIFNQYFDSASTTLQNFTFRNATGTSATTTNFFATTASSTNLFSSNLTVDNTTLYVDSVNHRVGIGTTSPTSELQIDGSTNRALKVGRAGGNSNFISLGTDSNGFGKITADSGLAILSTATLEALRILSTGLVGIGSTTPYAKLGISGFSSGVGLAVDALSGFTGNLIDLKLASSTKFSVNQAGDLLALGSTTLQNFTFNNATGSAATTTNLYTSGQTVLAGASGNVGIGTTTPGGLLEAYDAITTSSAGQTHFLFNANSGSGTNDADVLTVRTGRATSADELNVVRVTSSSGDLFNIRQSGNVGIGTSTPQALLSVNGGLQVMSPSVFFGNSGTEGGQIVFGWKGRYGTSQTTQTWNVDVDTNDNFRIFSEDASAATRVVLSVSSSTGFVTIGSLLGTSATITNATTTNFFATTASSTSLFGSALDFDNHTLYVDSTNHRVGISTTTPVQLLDVDGSASFGSSATGRIRLVSASAGGTYNYIQSGDAGGTQNVWQGLIFGNYLQAVTGRGVKMIIDTNGNVGIATSSPYANLSVVGGTSGSVIAADALSGFAGRLLELKVASSTKFFVNETGGFLTLGSSTLQNFTASNATTTNATTTNFYASGTASTSLLFANSATIGNLTTGSLSAGSISGSITPTGFTQGSVIFSGAGGTIAQNNAAFFWDNSFGALGLGTTAPKWLLNLSTSTKPQLTLSDPSTLTNNHWSFRNAGGLLYIATSSPTTFATSSVSAFSINTSGRVGIGNDNPQAKLDVTGSFLVSGSSTLQNFTFVNATGTSATTTNFFATTASSTNLFGTSLRFDNSTLFVDSTNHRVGIGNTTPQNNLHIGNQTTAQEGSSVGNTVVRIEATSGNSNFPELVLNGRQDSLSGSIVSGQVSFLNKQSNASSTIKAYGDGALAFEANGTEGMRLDSSGRVGIGTAAPTKILDVSTSSSDGLTTTSLISDMNVSGIAGGFRNMINSVNSILGGIKLSAFNGVGVIGATYDGTNQGSLVFGTNNGSTAVAERLRITAAGNVGIGKAAPSTLLDVAGTASSTGLQVNGDAAITDSLLLTGSTTLQNFTFNNATGTSATTTNLYTSGQTILAATSGNVGIGTTSPSEHLALAGGNFLQVPTGPVYEGGADVSGTANIGSSGTTTNKVVVQGRYAYVASNGGSGTDCGTDRTYCELQIYDVSNPAQPLYVGGADSSGTANSGTDGNPFNDIFVSGRYAYVAVNGTTSSCSGTAGAGLGCELMVFDISNPHTPTYIGGADSSGTTNSGATGGNFNSVMVQGRYAYIGKANSSTNCNSASKVGCEFQIYDVSSSTAPTFVVGVDANGTVNSGTGNVAINKVFVAGRYAYVAKSGNATDCSSAIGCELQIYDISNPFSPSYTGGADASSTPNTGIVSSAFNDVYVQGRYAYVAKAASATTCVGASSVAVGNGAIGCELQIYDISNPTTPTYMGGVDSTGTANSGAGSVALNSVTVSGRYAYVAKGASAGTCSSTVATGCEFAMFDVSTSTTPVYMGAADAGGSTNSGTQSLGAQSVFVEGRYAYVSFGTDSSDSCSGTASNTNGCEIKVFDVTGIETTSLLAHSLEAGSLQVQNDIIAKGKADLASLNVGIGGIFSSGSLSVATTSAFLGNVGIGLSNPGFNLEVLGTSSTTNLFASFSTTTNATTTNFFATTASSTNLWATAITSGLINGQNISSAANFTGTVAVATSITDPLLIGGTAAGSTLTLESTSGAGSSDAIIFKTGSQSEAGRFTTAGRFGVGTSTPGSTLSVGGTGGASIGTDYGVAAPTNGLIVEGNVGIGTSVVSTLLHVYKSANDATSARIFLQNDNGGSGAGSSLAVGENIASNKFLNLGYLNTSFSSAGVFLASQGVVSSAAGATGGLLIDASASAAPIIFATNDTERARYTATGLGIGTTTPDKKLTVNSGTSDAFALHLESSGSSDTGILIGRTTVNGANIHMKTDATNGDYLAINVNGSSLPAISDTPQFVINESGNVGVGTTTPDIKFDINSVTAGDGLKLEASSVSTRNWGLGLDSNGYFALRDRLANSTRLTVDSSGNIGIGTTTPAAPLEVRRAGGAGALQFTINNVIGGSTRDAILTVNPDVSTDIGGFVFTSHNGGSGNVNALNITGAGNVGIGTTSPAAQLTVYGTGQATQSFSTTGNLGGAIKLLDTSTSVNNGGAVIFGAKQFDFAAIKGLLTNGANNGQGDIEFLTRPASTDSTLTNALMIKASGNIGIGTTTPVATLSVSTSAQQSGTTPLFAVASTTNTTLFQVLGNGDTAVKVGSLDLTTAQSAYTFRGRSDEGLFEDSFGAQLMSPENIIIGLDSNNNDTTNIFAITHNESTLYGASGSTPANELFEVNESGHITLEGVTSTGATGSGKFVFSISPTLTGTLTAADATFSGQILAKSGDATSPGFAFSADTNVGFFRAKSNELGVTTAGTEVSRFTLHGLGINETAPATSLHVASSSNEIARFEDTAAGGDPFISFYSVTPGRIGYIQGVDGTTDELRIAADSSNTAEMTFFTAGSERMRIDDLGRVGVGTSTPHWELEAADNGPQLAITDNSKITYNHWVFRNSGGTFYVDVADNSTFATSTTAKFTISTAGNIGIGDTSPQGLLTVGANDAFQVTSSGNISKIGANSVGLTGGSGTITFQTADLLPSTDNGFDLGNVASSWGCLTYNGGSLGVCASDQGLKRNITDFKSLGLDQVLGLRPVNFYYNSLLDPAQTGEQQIGLIAQEVEQVAPFMVTTRPVHLADGSYIQAKTVNYGVLTYGLINAVKELDAKVESQASTTLALEDRIAALESASTTYGVSTSTPGFVASVLESMKATIVDNVTHFVQLAVDTLTTNALTVGKADKPTGITIYDSATGQPYCIKVTSGQTVTLPGDCTTVSTSSTSSSSSSSDTSSTTDTSSTPSTSGTASSTPDTAASSTPDMTSSSTDSTITDTSTTDTASSTAPITDISSTSSDSTATSTTP